MNALVLALGGVRAAVFMGFALLFAAGYGIQTYRLQGKDTTIAQMRASQADERAANAEAVAVAERKARDAETTARAKLNKIAADYQEALNDAQADSDRVAADLRSGNLKLRQQWQACSAATGLPQAPAGGPVADAGADDREASAGRIVRAARECDVQVRALQAVIRSERD